MRLVILPAEGGWEHEVWPKSPAQEAPSAPIVEGASYFFELRGSGRALAAQLSIDDIELEALRPREDTARWRWTPGFHAGEVELVLRFDGSSPSIRISLITDPDKRKLSREQFARMVSEILEDTTALFRLSSFRARVAAGSGRQPPPIARLVYLYDRVEALERSIRAIASAPETRLTASDRAEPYWNARRATGPEIVRSLRGPIVRAQPGVSLPRQLSGVLPARVRRTQRSVSYDTRENRDIRAALRAWSAWLRVAEKLLRVRPDTDDTDLPTLQKVWARRVVGMRSRLDTLRHLPFLDEVGAATGPVLLTSVYKRVRPYRDFYRLYRDFQRGIADVLGDFLQLPLARTFDLYELWAFLRLARAAVERHGANQGDVDGLFDPQSASGRIVLAAKTAKVTLADGRTLGFQITYREYWNESTKLGSFSRAMRPDIVVSNPGTSLIVLDAKYRVEQGLDDSISSIHMYRDAIVREDEGSVASAVHAAYLIAPYIPMQQPADWKCAEMPGRLFHPTYRSHFHFGALTLRPGMTMPEVCSALDILLADAAA